MISLTPDEIRVLGVLIEKDLTTPEQYPLSLNAATNGSNQKNNRLPVTSLDEDRVFDALRGLRDKGLVVQVDQVGSRVPKYKHVAQAKLGVSMHEMVVLAELMLRGPQTIGEIRGRASRMKQLETLEYVKQILEQLASRPEPLVKELPPSPGTRAERYMQLLCPEAHPLDTPSAAAPAPAHDAMPGQRTSIDARVTNLEAEVSALRDVVRKLAASLGETDPFANQ